MIHGSSGQVFKGAFFSRSAILAGWLLTVLNLPLRPSLSVLTFFFTIWTTSSSSRLCTRPQRCGYCDTPYGGGERSGEATALRVLRYTIRGGRKVRGGREMWLKWTLPQQRVKGCPIRGPNSSWSPIMGNSNRSLAANMRFMDIDCTKQHTDDSRVCCWFPTPIRI